MNITESTISQIDNILNLNSKIEAFDKIIALAYMKLGTNAARRLVPYVESRRNPGNAISITQFHNLFRVKDWYIAEQLTDNLLKKSHPEEFPFVISSAVPNRQKATSVSESQSSPKEVSFSCESLLRFIKIEDVKNELVEMISNNQFDSQLVDIYKQLLKRAK